ncbi:uncharacterized protein LOC124932704 [Impatiens glandulifera]|uniref:uncharacterized protein LOC124932704 n=1 Tax=Impatiens glandulifera TaxID=253017 RepID=UPI001FB1037C|nr:uncharacterized protein LOC124932704 [Impatiens glandulifera]
MIEKRGLQQLRNTTGDQEWQKGIHRAKRSRFVYLPSESRPSEFAIFCPEPFQIPSSKYQTGNCSIQTSGGCCSIEDVSTSSDGMNPCSDKNDEQKLKKESNNLRDVTLTVERHYLEQKVPLVSLTSGLNLSAIIGHPIEVDALDDDGRRMFWPIWKTSRRTRVCYVQQTHHRHQIARNKPLKKPQSMSIDKMRQYSIGIAEGNIEIKKTKNDVPARVTCIPVKVAFSRLSVAVGS